MPEPAGRLREQPTVSPCESAPDGDQHAAAAAEQQRVVVTGDSRRTTKPRHASAATLTLQADWSMIRREAPEPEVTGRRSWRLKATVDDRSWAVAGRKRDEVPPVVLQVVGGAVFAFGGAAWATLFAAAPSAQSWSTFVLILSFVCLVLGVAGLGAMLLGFGVVKWKLLYNSGVEPAAASEPPHSIIDVVGDPTQSEMDASRAKLPPPTGS